MPLIASRLSESQGSPWHATTRLWDDGIVDPADARRGGAIVNVSSIAARTGSPGEYVDYAVRPGFIHTQMQADGGEPGRVDRLAPSVLLRRGGQPEEVAHAILWLLSDEVAYTTGGFIDVAGGRR